jgi:hypothetical protein
VGVEPAALTPILVLGSYRIGLVKIPPEKPGQPVKRLAKAGSTLILKIPYECVVSFPGVVGKCCA